MWPRILSQLVELLPHATRLIPMADAFLTTRRDAERSQAAAMAAMSGGIREDLLRVSDAFAGVSRQLANQEVQIAALQGAVTAAETHRLTQAQQMEWIIADLNSMRLWLKIGVVVIVLLLACLIALAVQIFRLR